MISVRATNVYEERSLGIFEGEDSRMEDDPSAEGSRAVVWGRYVAWHARQQLAFGMPIATLCTAVLLNHAEDMWWLGLALFLVCIIERDKIQDENNFQWFQIFTVCE